MFQLTEYASMWAWSVFGSLLFLGGWEFPKGGDWGLGWQLFLTLVKSFVWILVIMWVRATVPRLRIDQLMSFCWKVLLPMSLAQLLVNGFILVYDWPEELLTVTSGIGAAILVAFIIRRALRRPRTAGLVGRYRQAGVPAQ
jgi:NADH-quinone oxidoreductase subunit H